MSTPHPLRAYRTERGIRLDDLAAKAKTTKATLSRVESGAQTPSLALVRRLIDVTGGALSANDFLPASVGGAP